MSAINLITNKKCPFVAEFLFYATENIITQ